MTHLTSLHSKCLAPLFAAAVGLLLLSSCGPTAPKSLYYWDKYDALAYTYSKDQTEQAHQNLLKQYQKLIDQPGGIKKQVPPGIFAEYGFMLLKAGKTAEGLQYLRQEVELYPQSKILIERIIKQFEKK